MASVATPTDNISVSLVRSRTYGIFAIGEDESTDGKQIEKVELPANENDILHASSKRHGVPGSLSLDTITDLRSGRKTLKIRVSDQAATFGCNDIILVDGDNILLE